MHNFFQQSLVTVMPITHSKLPKNGRPIPVGYDFAIGVSGNAPTSTTPLLWTRALTTAGTWGKDSPWGLGAT